MTNKKAEYFIREHYDRPVSKREFLRWREKEIEAAYIGQKHLLDNKILSLAKIKAYQKGGLLTPMRHKGKVYLKRTEVVELLKPSNEGKSSNQ